ncbi:single-stranded DNA-binding protein [Nocardioides sp. MAHUQ-72]|uniref:single-stranded DNA-binding protein n=1 Tax=unclassified Nocardioides TaxID=2615069 RepID=UPI00361966B6
MSAPATKKKQEPGGSGVEAVNEVRLVGRVSAAPEERILPSGDALWTFRVVVPRQSVRAGSRQTVDVLECVVWGGRVRRSVVTWQEGDQVEITGSVRRRFFRAGGSAASRVEIEVYGGRVMRRAANG